MFGTICAHASFGLRGPAAAVLLLITLPLQAFGADPEEDLPECMVKGDVAACTRVINDRSQPADVHERLLRMRAIKHREKGDFKSAISDYTALIKLDPKSTDALANRALAYQAAGDLSAAIADFTKAIAAEPGDAEAVFELPASMPPRSCRSAPSRPSVPP